MTDLRTCPECGHRPAWTKCHKCGWEKPATTDVTPEARLKQESRLTLPNDDRSEDERKADARESVEALGWRVRDYEQGYRPKTCRKCGERIPGGGSTRVPLGTPDWYVTGFGVGAWIEWKSADGKQTEHQERFQAECDEDGVPYAVCRTTAEAIAFLRSLHRRPAA